MKNKLQQAIEKTWESEYMVKNYKPTEEEEKWLKEAKRLSPASKEQKLLHFFK